MESVMINGVRYVPDPLAPDEVQFWFMFDNHTFKRLRGATLDEVLAQADEVEAASSYGMLCPATLMHGKKEVRRVGPATHSYSARNKNKKDMWEEGKAAWRAELESDTDVMRLLTPNVELTGAAPNETQSERK